MIDRIVLDATSKALDLLRQRGWFKETGYGASGANCIMTALSFTSFHPFGNMAVEAIAEVIREQYPERFLGASVFAGGQVIYFNDHPDTTFADVERVLEKVIAG